MSTELEEFHQEFFQDVLGTADASGQYLEDAFFEVFCDNLVEAGELDTADRVHYSRRGIRVDGYGGDPITTDGTLSLIVVDFNQAADVATLTATDMEAVFKRLSNFLENCLDPEFRNSLEESSPGFGLADLISERWQGVGKVRLFLITNRQLSARVDGRSAGELLEIPVTYSVWDLGRLYRYVAQGHGREDIEVDLTRDFGGPILALPAHLDGGGYEAYLAVVPGAQLAAIYDRWGARLLEQNVRCFLQARGNVNKGIRNTIENEPSMFLAYNNGITATAESIEAQSSPRGLLLTKLRNLQIVNGGQTTASIHAASKKKDVDLSRVFVQMKLSIVEPSLAVEMVPKISEYANSQNRVNAADFFANHPFHIRIEGFSRRIFAPSAEGTFRESKWFYERARGQYQDATAYLTPTAKKKFQQDYPKRQVFSKTDLAKFLNPWRGQPHIVSRGAQKNFVDFANAISKEWASQPDSFNEAYFRQLIARAIVFRETERLVTEQPWYEGGYRANIVVYAIAKVAADVHRMDMSVDFEAIWRAQTISPRLREALLVAAKLANEIIVDTPRNVTEWAKQQACWHRIESAEVEYPKAFLSQLITLDQLAQQMTAAKKDQKVLNGIAAQTAVVGAGAEVWREVIEWGMGKGLLTPTELEILRVAAAMPAQVPSDRQSARILETLRRLREEGCQIGADVM
ncbi:MAG: AIPR family protein [Dehalococcoidia bacterium]|nr:AIPR family protein [Dehalococcoidia bacterium]